MRKTPVRLLVLLSVALLVAAQDYTAPPTSPPPDYSAGDTNDYDAPDTAAPKDYATPPAVPEAVPTGAPIPPTGPATPGGTDYASTDTDYAASSNTDPATGTTVDPGNGCDNKYHKQVASEEECLAFCQEKIDKHIASGRDGSPSIDPKTYTSDFGNNCCNCKFRREGGPPTSDVPIAPPLDLSLGEDDDDKDDDDDDNGRPVTLPPATPLSPEEITALMDITATPLAGPGQVMVKAVLKIVGMPYYLPLPGDQIAGIILAFNNITSTPWHYMGSEPNVPDVNPTVPSTMGEVVVRGRRLASTTIESDSPVYTSRRLMSIAASRTLLQRAPPASPAPKTGVPAPTPEAPDYGAEQDTGTPPEEDYTGDDAPTDGEDPTTDTPPEEDYTPPEDDGNDYEDAPAPPPNGVDNSGGDYDKAPDTDTDNNGGDYGTDGTPPDDGTNDYNSGNDYNTSPTVNPDAIPGQDPNLFPQVPAPIPAPVIFPSPVPLLPPPPPPNPPPPPPPSSPIPEGSDGFWVFMLVPLDPQTQQLVSRALVVSTDPNGKQEMKYYMQLGGLAYITDVELRYVGTGPIDLSKRYTGPLFGASSSASSGGDSGGSDMSATTIGIIVGAVCGAVVLVAAVGAFAVSSKKKKNAKLDKEAITQRWKLERDLAESQRIKLATGSATGNPDATMKSFRSTLGGTAAGMSVDDLERHRAARRANTLQTEAILSMKQVELEQGTPAAPPKKSMTMRLESMRSALGLDKAPTKGGGSGAGRDDGWFVDEGAASTPLAGDGDKGKGVFGKMFGKK